MSSVNQLAELPQTSNVARYLIFSLGRNFYAINTENVIEILENLPFTPIPIVNAEWFLGVGNFHGEVVPIVDIGVLQQNGCPSQTNRFVVLHSLERKNFEMAIPVSAVCEINSIENFNKVERGSFLVAESVYRQGRVYLIDFEKLVSQILNKIK